MHGAGRGNIVIWCSYISLREDQLVFAFTGIFGGLLRIWKNAFNWCIIDIYWSNLIFFRKVPEKYDSILGNNVFWIIKYIFKNKLKLKNS